MERLKLKFVELRGELDIGGLLALSLLSLYEGDGIL
jgi:hypothetical protein